jgi:tetratricopeptide (TPR) repeat protein
MIFCFFIASLHFMRFLCTILLFLFASTAFAQKDSLLHYIKLAEQEKNKGNLPQALNSYLRVAFIQENINDEINLASTYEAIAGLYQNRQIYQKSLDYYQNAHKIRQKQNNPAVLVRSLQQVGMSHYLVNNLSDATKYYREGLKLAQEQKDTKTTADILNKLFFIAQSGKEYEKASQYATESLALYENLHDTLATSNTLNNLGFLYREQSNTRQANEYFQKALTLNQKMVKSRIGENRAIILQNIGVIYTNLADDKNSNKFFYEALAIRQQQGNKTKIAETYNYIAKHYLVEEYYDKAEQEATAAINIARPNNDYRNLIDSYKILSEVYRKSGDYKKSDVYNRLKEEARDSLVLQKEKSSQNFQQKQVSAEREESEYRLLLAEKQKQELILQQLKLEADKKQKELELNQQQLASLEKDKKIQAAESQRQIAENLRVQQDLEISKQKLLAEQQEQKVVALQKEQALQALAIEQQKRKADEAELEKTKSETSNKLAAQEREKEKQQTNFIILSGLGISLFLLVILGLVAWSFLQKRRDNEKLKTQSMVIQESNEELRASEEELKQNLEELNATQEQLQVQYNLLNVRNRNIADSINYAKRIQNAMLPRLTEILTVFPQSFVLFRPRDVISGDFYWFANKGNESIIVAADCTGHGVPGAFMSILGSSLLNQIVHDKEIHEPNRILDLLHVGVEEMLNQKTEDSESKDGMDASILLLNHEEKNIQFAGANNPLYVIAKQPLSFSENTKQEVLNIEAPMQNWQLTEIKGDKRPIGGRVMKQNSINYTLKQFSFDQELHVYLFSDGFVDQIGGEARRKLMSKGFKKLLLENHEKPFEEQKIVLNNFFEDWISETKKQLDDVLVMGIKI